MYIQDQDREHSYWYNGNLSTRPAIFNGVCIGINLYTDNNFLGTFDSPQEALQEMESIQACKTYKYTVKGYYKPSAWDTIKEAMQDD